jgi:mono/diheme cytochrome c family protein
MDRTSPKHFRVGSSELVNMCNPVKLSLLIGLAVCLSGGCGARIDKFESNLLFAKRMERESSSSLAPALKDAQAALERLFGTPDRPSWPEFLAEDEALGSVVSLERLTRAAGPISSDEKDTHFGLYRKHCIACHGTNGGGNGPTSRLLNPYPRDFRLGKFKSKSTPLGSKPTRDDLKRLLFHGIPGTSMTAFNLLKEEDIDALVDYVIYLSVRGEVERALLTEAAFELDYDAGERLVDFRLEDSAPDDFLVQWSVVEEAVKRSVSRWAEAPSKVPEMTGPPTGFPIFGEVDPADEAAQASLRASIESGRKVFQGSVASCAKCHGLTAMGDGMTQDYDDWTKDWTTGISPQDKAIIKPLLSLGALKPRNILPRNLRNGVYRGGSRPIDLYYRIVHGIEGTPMPAAAVQPDNPLGISQDEVWDLVNYLLSLPGEDLSQDLVHATTSPVGGAE